MAGLLFFLAAAGLMLFFSIGPPSSFENAVLGRMQFKYRLVTYINILLFCAFLQAIGRGALAGASVRNKLKPVYLIALILFGAGFSLGFIWHQNKPKDTIIHNMSRNFRRTLNDDTYKCIYFYGDADYAIGVPNLMPEHLQKLPYRLVLFEHDYVHFGSIKPYAIELSEPHHLGLNIYLHPWNHLAIENLDTGEKRIALWQDMYHLNNPFRLRFDDGLYNRYVLPAGRFKLEPLFAPPLAWVVLRKGHYLAIFILAAASLVLLTRTAWLDVRRPPPHEGGQPAS